MKNDCHKVGRPRHARHRVLGVEQLEIRRLLAAPGDANRDGVFDHDDIVMVLEGGKYLADEPASWEQGDWNGDAVFDQIDIVSALHSDHYLDGLSDELLARLEEMTKRNNAPSGAVMIDFGDSQFQWTAATGIAEPSSGEPMTAEHQFRIASVSKVFTGVVVMQLVEEGLLSLESTLDQLLTADDLPAGYGVGDLHIYQGEPRGAEITVGQLLNHNSGLADFAGDHFFDDWLKDITTPGTNGIKDKQWSAEEMLDAHFRTGANKGAKFPPGQGFYYTDTNYVLLGVIIEKLTHSPLVENYRTRIYDKLGMSDTYLEWYEPARGPGLSHHLMHTSDMEQVSEYARTLGDGITIDLIAEHVNTSFEWAGGGLVSTLGDLTTFMRGLFARQLFEDESTLAQMLKGTGQDLAYGFGIGNFAMRNGHKAYGHQGLWGVAMFHVPDISLSIVFTQNHTNGVMNDALGTSMRGYAWVLDRYGLL